MKLKLISLILSLTLLCPMLFACNSKPAEEVIEPRVAEKVTNVYSSQIMSMPEDTYIDTGSVFIVDGRINLRCSRVGETEDGEYLEDNFLYSFDFGGGNATETPIKTVNEGAYVYKYILDTQGNSYLIENSYDMETYVSTFLMTKFSPSGEVLYSIDPSAYYQAVDNAEMYGSNEFYPQYMTVTANGEVLLSTDQSVICIANDGTKLFDLTFDNWIDNLGSTNDGRVYVTYYDMNEGGVTYKFIDIEGKKLGDTLKLPESLKMTGSDCQVMPGVGYDMYIREKSGVYGMNNADTEPTKLLDYINSDISPDSIRSFYIIDADHFVCSGFDQITYKDSFVFLTRVPDDEVKPKLLINLSCVYGDQDLTSYIVRFNQTNDTYRIILHDYGELNTDDNYQLGGQTLTNEIIAGNVPDILLFSNYNGVDGDSLMEKGLFCDLYEYMDKDTELTRDKLLNCVLKPFEYDGKLYQLVTGFTVNTVAGKVSNIGSAKSWTIEEMLAKNEGLPEGVTLMDTQYMTKAAMLNQLLNTGANEFIDMDTLLCTFESDAFIKLLEYCNTLPAEIDYDSIDYSQNEDQYIGYREDKILLNPNVYLYSFADYLQLKFQFNFEPINLIGFPTKSGIGSVLNADNRFAITTKSPVKDGAWEFLKFMLSDEIQTGGIEMRGMHRFPVTKNAMQKYAEQEMKQYYFFNFSGGWGSSDQPFSEEQKGHMGGDGLEGHLEQSDVDTLLAFFDTIAENYTGFDSKILEIITEEATPYFNGDKTAADAAKIIQSKISIYINEIS